MIAHYDGFSGYHILSMPKACAEDCSAQGRNDEAVEYWVSRVKWHAQEPELRRICRETGAWEDTETADLDTIKRRVLWMAAHDWRENREQTKRRIW